MHYLTMILYMSWYQIYLDGSEQFSYLISDSEIHLIETTTQFEVKDRGLKIKIFWSLGWSDW